MRSAFHLLIASLCLLSLASAGLINVPSEANYDFIGVANEFNYPVETHEVTTQDGYVLTYFRIQAKNTQIKSGLKPILCHHGLLDSADSFLLNQEEQAPGFILANAGFDVWFGNNRGNKYCQEHQSPIEFDVNDPSSAFWDFSWQEMSQYDITAGLTYVAQTTGFGTVDYMGHSEGTTIMFAALARQEQATTQYLNRFIALAPAVFVQYSTSPLVKIGGAIQAGKLLKDLDDMLDHKKFGFQSDFVRHLWEDLCEVARFVCVEKIRLLSDTNPEVDNTDRLPITTGHYPAGSSIQNMFYWQQMFQKSTFSMYDFGTAGNNAHYGQPTAPEYDLGSITHPIYMFVGQYDELASPADTADLRDHLTGSSHLEYKSYPLGHSSFMFGKNVAQYMADVITVLQS